MGKTNNLKSYKVHSLERGLDLLELLADSAREMSLSELSQRGGLSTPVRATESWMRLNLEIMCVKIQRPPLTA